MVNLLNIENLSVAFRRRNGTVSALRDVSISLRDNEMLGIVGESGCGKSTLALSVLNLIPPSECRVRGGRIILKNKDGKNDDIDILSLEEKRLTSIRGKRISIIFQDPFSSFNPVFTIGEQISEAIRIHSPWKGNDTEKDVMHLLEKVHLPNPGRVMKNYPHQMSGGMQQRAMIAMALSCNPEILIADEPTTALDVTIQHGILDLLKTLQTELKLSIILITHDMGIIQQFCSRIVILYAGCVVEEGNVGDVFKKPAHPYTEGLLNSLPKSLPREKGDKKRRLKTIPGQVPDMSNLPSGCKFHPRCPYRIKKCLLEEPILRETDKTHKSRCILANEFRKDTSN